MYHDAVELPQYNHNPVDEDYLDTKGIESLRVPYLCGQPREIATDEGAKATVVDVIFNTRVIKRCADSSGRPQQVMGSQYYRMRVSELAMRFVREDTTLAFSRKYSVLKNRIYYGDGGSQKVQPFPLPREISQEMEADYHTQKKEHEAHEVRAWMARWQAGGWGVAGRVWRADRTSASP